MNNYINISSIIILLISIIMFEIGYKKAKKNIFVYGIEILGIAIFILLTKYMPKVLECDTKTYIETGIVAFIAYYIIKIALIYTKRKKVELDNLSDIKEIVKDEPVKKITKRKNIKKEEGK